MVRTNNLIAVSFPYAASVAYFAIILGSPSYVFLSEHKQQVTLYWKSTI